MADAYQLEATADRYLLEDGSGVYLLEVSATTVIPGVCEYTVLLPSRGGLS